MPGRSRPALRSEQLLDAARRYKQLGCMRRFSAVLKHREAGFGANAMGAWIVPPEQRDSFGQTAASFSSVSHCYQRPTYEDWPYSIFTMVHGQSQGGMRAGFWPRSRNRRASRTTPRCTPLSSSRRSGSNTSWAILRRGKSKHWRLLNPENDLAMPLQTAGRGYQS